MHSADVVVESISGRVEVYARQYLFTLKEKPSLKPPNELLTRSLQFYIINK
jgi:hypothetical protein